MRRGRVSGSGTLSHPSPLRRKAQVSVIGNANGLKLFLILAAKWAQLKVVASLSPEFVGGGGGAWDGKLN